jgi:hypothetical protein
MAKKKNVVLAMNTRMSEFDFNYLMQLTRLFQNKIPVIATAFKQILDWL